MNKIALGFGFLVMLVGFIVGGIYQTKMNKFDERTPEDAKTQTRMLTIGGFISGGLGLLSVGSSFLMGNK